MEKEKLDLEALHTVTPEEFQQHFDVLTEEAKSNEEMFDISNITEEEAAVAVNESDGGFSVADKQYDTSFQARPTRGIQALARIVAQGEARIVCRTRAERGCKTHR